MTDVAKIDIYHTDILTCICQKLICSLLNVFRNWDDKSDKQGGLMSWINRLKSV